MQFTKASKKRARLRLALCGPAGSGKTYTALTLASALGDRVAVMDTEHGSASKYADIFSFDAIEPKSFSPNVYIEAVKTAAEAGYPVMVIDSLSHAWTGKGGALEMVDSYAKRERGNSFGAWREVTPLHNAMVDALVSAPMHLIVTMRSKMEYLQEKNERTGRTEIRKVGLQPVQREGLEYEFDVVGDMDTDNNLVITKTRCSQLSGAVVQRPGVPLARTLLDWLEGAPLELDRDGEVTDTFTGEVVAGPAYATDAQVANLRSLMLELAGPDILKKLTRPDKTAAKKAEALLVGAPPLEADVAHSTQVAVEMLARARHPDDFIAQEIATQELELGGIK